MVQVCVCVEPCRSHIALPSPPPAQQSEHMIKQYHIYLLDGRINMCGITAKNVDYVAKAIVDTVVNVAPGQNRS